MSLPDFTSAIVRRSLSIPIDPPFRPYISPYRAKLAEDIRSAPQRQLAAQAVERAAQATADAAHEAAIKAEWEHSGPPLDLSGFR